MTQCAKTRIESARAQQLITLNTASEPHRTARNRLKGAPLLPHSRRFGRWDPIPPMWLEGRIYLESLKLIRDPVFRGDDVPSGLRKPILLVPGFLAGAWTLRTLFDRLKRVEYRPRIARVPVNVTYSEVKHRPL